MNVDQTVFQLAVLFLPGVITAGIVDVLTLHKARTTFEFTLRAFVFGIGCYVIYFFILWVGFGTVHQIAALDHQLTLAEMQAYLGRDAKGPH